MHVRLPAPRHVYWQSYLQRVTLQSTIPADALEPAGRRWGRHFRAEQIDRATADPMSHTPIAAIVPCRQTTRLPLRQTLQLPIDTPVHDRSRASTCTQRRRSRDLAPSSTSRTWACTRTAPPRIAGTNVPSDQHAPELRLLRQNPMVGPTTFTTTFKTSICSGPTRTK